MCSPLAYFGGRIPQHFRMKAARFMIRLQMGPLAVKQYQYAYVQEGDIWMLSLAVDETMWSEYEPTFTTIAESFRLYFAR
jgi:hypothetical protein